MELILLLILVTLEIGFAAFEFTKSETKSSWSLKRLVANGIETAVYLLMVLLPGIDFSFRFKGLLFMLIVRIVFSGIFFLIFRKSEKQKKKAAIIISALISILILTVSLTPAFLFSDYHGRPTTGEYKVAECAVILTDKSRTEEFENDGSCREVPVHFYYPENVNELSKDSAPLIIFSHGAFGYYQSNASTFLELASHGYIVASLDHPYHSFFTKDTNGKTITVDPEFFQTALQVGNDDDTDKDETYYYEITSKWMELRTADMNFVIDELKAADSSMTLSDSWFYEKADEETIISILNVMNCDIIGLMGHSLGGATSVTVGRRDDISAVIDLDGTMIGEEIGIDGNNVKINDEPYPTPLLSIDNDEHHNSRIMCKENGIIYSNNVILENAENGYETYIKGSDHMNFTDLPLFSPALAGILGTGSVDAGKCVDQVNAIVLHFFDSFLKGTGNFSVEESY